MIQQSPAKTKSFLKAINKAAMQKCKDIAKQIEETTAAEMQRAEDEARRDGHLKIELAKSRIEAKSKMEVASYENEKKKEIYKKRQNYQKEVFKSAADLLRAFVKSPEYKPYLEQCLADLGDKVSKNLTFYVLEEDTVAAKAIAKRFTGAKTEYSTAFEIGGFRVRDDDKHILIDETLDTKLQEQTDWFLLHSQMKVDL